MIDPTWTTATFTRERIAPGEALPDLRDAPVLAVDVETKPLPTQREFKRAALYHDRAEIFGFSVAVPPSNGEPGRAWYLPIRHSGPDAATSNLDPALALGWLQSIFSARLGRTLINQNIKFDLKHLAANGVHVPPETDLWCTLVAAQLVDEREETHSLKPLCAKWLNMPAAEERLKDQYIADSGQKKDYSDWSILPVDLAAPYGCGDVERALKMAAHCQKELVAQELEEVFAVERGVTRVLTDAELTGLAVDVRQLTQEKALTLMSLTEVEKAIEAKLGVAIDPDKPAELADVVANRLGLPILHRTRPTKTHEFGQPKFDDEVLLEYLATYPQHAELFFLIRQDRCLTHLLQSFIEPYLAWHVNGIIHPNFNQNTARTGRMTGDSPNLQQVKKVEKWKSPAGDTWIAPGAKQFFVPRPGESLLFFDYSQIEYRLFAHYTGSPRLVEAYQKDPNLDMHKWAAEVPLGGRIPRDMAKHINFGIIYGMGEQKLIHGMARFDSRITDAAAKEVLTSYYKEIPELRPLQQRVAAALRARGYVRTILGRKRRASRYGSWSRASQQAQDDRGLLPYQSMNAICQGSGADVMKERMVAFYHSDLPKKYNAQILVPVHDELIFRCPAEAAAPLALELKPLLEAFHLPDGTPRLRVPIYVNGKSTTTRWSEAKEMTA